MIISHKHKFIFIKTRKTAGTSIEILLSSICGPDDIITSNNRNDEKIRQSLGFSGPQNTLIPFRYYSLREWLLFLRKGRRLEFTNHNSAAFVRRHIPISIWQSYYKFTFERDPYDRYISNYYWWMRKSIKVSPIHGFIQKRLSTAGPHHSIYRIKGILAVDKVFPYEQLEKSIEEIDRQLNLKLPVSIKDVRAKSGIRQDRRKVEEVLDEKSIRLINRRERETFELMNYELLSVSQEQGQ